MIRISARLFGLVVGAIAVFFGNRAAVRFARAFISGLVSLTKSDPEEIVVRTFEWRIPRRILVGVEVEVRRHGVDLSLVLEDNAQRVLYFTGDYERAFTEWLLSELRCGDVFLDIGSHIGIHALAVAKRLTELGDGSVLAIEATPDSSAKIRCAASNNGLKNIRVFQIGAGEAEGTLRLYGDTRYSQNDAGVRSAFNSGPLIAEVPVAPLDRVLQEAAVDRIDLVKLDIEGSEMSALKGMRRSLLTYNPRFIAIEMDERRLEQSGSTPESISKFLETIGYRYTGNTLLKNAIYATTR